MTDTDTFEYYQLRERRELALADRAPDRSVGSIHRQMATHYSTLLAKFAQSKEDCQGESIVIFDTALNAETTSR